MAWGRGGGKEGALGDRFGSGCLYW